MKYDIVSFDNDRHRKQVISLWRDAFGYEASHNEPNLVIDKKIEFNDGLFFVAVDDHRVVGTVMAGYDGHRGWIYSLAVSSAVRKIGVGSALMSFAEKKLAEKRISMGKRLVQNINMDPIQRK